MKSYYEILGIESKADSKTIKSAYKKMAFRHHPDRNPDDSAAETRFKLINEAYQTLSDPQKRYIYDLKLAGQWHEPDFQQTEQTPRPQRPYRYQTYTRYNYRNENRPRYVRKVHVPLAYRLKAYGVTALFLILFWLGLSAFSRYTIHHKAEELFEESTSYLKTGNYELAFYKLNQAINLDKTYAEAYFQRGLIELHFWKDYKYAEINFTDALRYSKKAFHEIYLKRGISRMKAGKYEEALIDFKKASEDKKLVMDAQLFKEQTEKMMKH
jgi:curved DNA-binding protein CbpA